MSANPICADRSGVKKPVAVLVGKAYLDCLCDVDALPTEGDNLRPRRVLWTAGGLGRPALALSQIFDVRMFTPVADDPAGEFLMREMGAAGVTVYRGSCEGTPTSMVLTGGINRTCVAYSPPLDDPADLSVFDGVDVRLVFGDGNDLESYCEMVDRHPEALCGIDVGASVRPGCEKGVWMADVICGHETALVGLTRQDDMGAAADVLLGGAASLVVATDGANGVTAWSGAGRWHTPAPVVDVVDTTGCGDTFHAKLVAGLIAGESHEGAVRDAVHVATRFAATWGNPDDMGF